MNAALMTACARLDGAAAALRVYLVGISPLAEETDESNAPTRQVALRGIVLEIERARAVLLASREGNDLDNIPLMMFAELTATAEQALWVTLGENGKGAPSNADLCELLGMALRFHAEGRQAWPAMPAPAADAAHQAGQGAKGGAA